MPIPEDVVDPEAYLMFMQEYTDLKSLLLDRTRQTAAALAAYLFLASTGEAALCALIGGGFSYCYLLWLFYDVDSVKPTDRVPMMEAEEIEAPMTKMLAKAAAGYRQAAQPRLLVPILLAAGTAAVGAKMGPLPMLDQGCLLAGFLSYKVALLIKVIEDLSPKEGEKVRSKPSVVAVEDELDMYGRPKERLVLPTDALPEEDRGKVLEAAEALEKRNEARKAQ